jgi:hypothetical protein
MGIVTTRSTAALLAIVLLAACVPDPANRIGDGPSPTPSTSPEPTPQGPTPTPSFSRPTPTPQPTFLLYRVARGDTLTRIAKKFQTTGESISYWNRAMYPSLNPDSGRYRPNDLKVGWVLQIIPKTVVDPENLPTFPPSPGSSASPGVSAAPSG